jgi:UMF1 family MFS transporter
MSDERGRADAGREAVVSGRDARRAQRAWCLYDWANSAFATSVVSAILPPYFASVAGRSMPAHLATATWGYASALALFATALLAPIVGAAADRTGLRKPILFACVLAGSLGTAAIAIAPWTGWTVLIAAFAAAFIAFATGNVLYDSLLPSVAAPEETDAVSARGFAWGYLGGGLLLAAHLAIILAPQRFGLRDADAATRVAFGSVAVWWLVFSIPLFRDVPEPPASGDPTPLAKLPGAVFAQLGRTLAGLRRRPDLLTFLIAFWLYSDGIGTIIKMATIYGNEIGIGRGDLIGALLLVQLLAAPASLAFGRLAKPIGARGAVLLGIGGYVVITMFAFFLSKPWHFWALATMVALVQGGTQALSRSLFVSLVPRRQVSELFGFYSVSEKLAGVVGPVMFGAVTQWAGGGRLATLTLLPLFIGGAWLLTRVDLERGARAAAADA